MLLSIDLNVNALIILKTQMWSYMLNFQEGRLLVIMGFVLKSFKKRVGGFSDLMNHGINCLLCPISITLSLVQSVKDALGSFDTLFYILNSGSAHLPV